MRSICVLLVHGLTVCASHAQTFDLEQFEQVFRPRLRIDGRFQPESAFRDTTGGFSNAEGTAVLTFPIASRFKAGFELDTAARGLREVLTNSVRVEARQLLGSVRLGARQVRIGFDSTRVRNLFTASAGVLVSLRAATVRQAQQTLMIGVIVLIFGCLLVISMLPPWLFSTLSYPQMLLVAIGIFALLDAILLGLALLGFQRAHLILS